MKLRHVKVRRFERGVLQNGYLSVSDSDVYLHEPLTGRPLPPRYDYPTKEAVRRAGWRVSEPAVA